MAKVAQYPGAVILKGDGETLSVSIEYTQGEIRTTLSVVLSPEEFMKVMRGQRVDVEVLEDAVQTRRKPKQGTLGEEA